MSIHIRQRVPRICGDKGVGLCAAVFVDEHGNRGRGRSGLTPTAGLRLHARPNCRSYRSVGSLVPGEHSVNEMAVPEVADNQRRREVFKDYPTCRPIAHVDVLYYGGCQAVWNLGRTCSAGAFQNARGMTIPRGCTSTSAARFSAPPSRQDRNHAGGSKIGVRRAIRS